MDSWNPTDTEHLADTRSGEGEAPGRPLEDRGHDVTDEVQPDEVEVGGVDIIDLVDEVEVIEVTDVGEVEIVGVVDRVEVVGIIDQVGADEVLAPAHGDQGGEHPVVGTAPVASAGVTGPVGTTPEESIDEVEAVLDQVDQALARLDDGTYGRCVNCGRAIEDDRLAEDPTDQRCGECPEPVLSGVD